MRTEHSGAFDCITVEPGKMGGRACIRGMRITVGLVLSFIAGGATIEEIRADYPDLNEDDFRQALAYAASRVAAVDPAPLFEAASLSGGTTEGGRRGELVIPLPIAEEAGRAPWQERIGRDPAVLGGKPVLRGTRLAVDFILGLMGDGWTERDVIPAYPAVTREDIGACIDFACDALDRERVGPSRPG
jgi:uncharacterized protein (DUF433 family)